MATRKSDLIPFQKTSIIQGTEQYSYTLSEYRARVKNASLYTNALEKILDGRRTPVEDVQTLRNILNKAKLQLPMHEETLASHHTYLTSLRARNLPHRRIAPWNSEEES